MEWLPDGSDSTNCMKGSQFWLKTWSCTLLMLFSFISERIHTKFAELDI